MLQVLLVDDEIAVTDSMQHGIDWQSLGLHVAAVAMSGMQALQYIHANPVDIVITDIRMADMDGLSLCQRIFQLNRNIQTIIVSGFAEFSYAQKALSYGVIGYCLKPIEYSELTRYLQLAVHRLGHYSRSSNFDDLLDAMHQGDADEVRRQLKTHNFTGESYYLAVSSSKSPVVQTGQNVLAFQMGHRRFGYLCANPIDVALFSRNFERSRCKCLIYCPEAVPIASMGAIIKKLNNGVFQYFFDSGRRITTRVNAPKQIPLSRELEKAIADRDTSLLIQLLRQLKNLPPEQFSLSAVWNLYGVLAASEVYGPIVAVDDLYSPEQMVFRFQSFPRMIDIICGRLQDGPGEAAPAKLSNTAFLYMIKYIDLHLTEDCSLQQLAKEMNMTANYLGQVFKRETGKPYTQYITELRIDRAKNLLLSGDLSIGEISNVLGFNDYFYFLKTFKKVTGVTPKQYRQEQSLGSQMLFTE